MFLYQKVEEKEKIINDPAKNMELERKVVLDRLNKFIELPSDEEPTIVTILDAEKLRNQPLFLKAENGDKLIVYDKARKVLLYRYTTNKIIEFDSIDMMPAVGQ
ncbi:MAG: hypothetical protein BWY68_00665 [bacterium ADurb.Bin400]|nr:MAG: hypothetical protein BWY68_00665 [bacterium ADurb.Bin400]